MTPDLRAAYSLLNRGVRYKLPAPVFFKLIGITEMPIIIKPLYAGTELRIAAILSEAGLTDPEAISKKEVTQLMLEHYKTIVRIVAVATLNSRSVSAIRLYLRMRLLKRLSVWQLYELYSTIKEFSGTAPFMNITRLAIQTRMTAPNLGQTQRGS